MRKGKLAIITSGGGLRCSYGVGVILCLAQRYGITEPDILIACSGSAGTGSYYVAKQYDSIRNIWENLLPTKRFLNKWRFWRLIDIDYLIDSIFKEQDPLNARSVVDSPTQYLIPAMNRVTGAIEYFSNRDGTDVFEAMRATKAMPIAFRYDPRVMIAGWPYCDSSLSSRPTTHLRKAVSLGATKIVMVDNTSARSGRHLSTVIFNAWMRRQLPAVVKTYCKECALAGTYQVPTEVEVHTIKPQRPLRISTLDNRQPHIREAIRQGYDDMVKSGIFS